MATISTEPFVDGLHDFGVWQRRLERWRRVRHLLDRADLASGRLRRECAQAAATELQLLADAEALWSYPGGARVAELRGVLAGVELSRAVTLTRDIVRLLELYGDGAAVAERDLPATSRYFTALVVSDDAAALVATLEPALAAERRDSDARVYELVPVTSIEVALVAARCNPWVEALLLAPRAPRFATASTLLLTAEEQRRLSALTGPDPVSLGWLDEWLHRERPSLTLLPATAAPRELHLLLARVG